MRYFWELEKIEPEWELFQRAPDGGDQPSGCSEVVKWEGGRGPLATDPGARIQGLDAHGKPGVLVGRMGRIAAGPYLGGFFDKSCVVLVPKRADMVEPILAYATSGEYEEQIRAIDTKIGAATSVMVEVPFDREVWTAKAHRPTAECADPIQWLFQGQPSRAKQPLQVAVARLLGYRWPNQQADELDDLVEGGGLMALPAVAGEVGAADRLRQLLERAYGDEFSSGLLDRLLAGTGAGPKTLLEWLREKFFEQHVQLFQRRPFIWHVWDGRRDGFSALVNYHMLDRALLEKLTYAVLGAWIEMQQSQVTAGVAGADLRLAASRQLQQKLKLILMGESPYDVYVRWKSVAEQPVGWAPDVNDGVRVNIRPFVEADVLRLSANRMRGWIKWGTDRGRSLDGRERDNDVHLTLKDKRDAGAR
jgi:hypothetical protein